MFAGSQTKCFFVWDNNHRLKAWYPFINKMHYEGKEWHIMPECIVLEGTKNVIQLLMAMTDLNK